MAIAWSGQQKPSRAEVEGTAVLTWEGLVVVGEAAERPAGAKMVLSNGKGFVRRLTKHERATPVGGLLGVGEWNAGYCVEDGPLV
jgi:hypothetical protein